MTQTLVRHAIRRGLPALIVVALAIPAGASAASLVADYRFDDTLSSSVGTAPALVDIGPGPNAFATETVNGVSERVLTFADDSGLSLTAAPLPADDYSVVLTMRRTEMVLVDPEYQRILDLSSGTVDAGLYTLGRNLDFYDDVDPVDSDHLGAGDPLAENTYAEIAFTRNPAKQFAGYVNGLPQLTYTDVHGPDSALLTAEARFFKDDSGEDSPGAVARIRLYSGALTAEEVASIAAGFDPTVDCRVPDVKGKKLAAAKQLLLEARCAAGAVTRKFSKKVRKQKVISQTPAAGTTGPAGTTVALKVSKGRRKR